MTGLPAGARVYLVVEPHDMRKSFNGLSAVARELVSRGLGDGAMWAVRGNASRLGDEQRELREALRGRHAQLGHAHATRDFLADAWHDDRMAL